MYEKALSILNASRDQKAEAFAFLLGACNYGHLDAKVMVAWAKLFGDTLKQDIDGAKELFIELADNGYPEGHLVRFILLYRNNNLIHLNSLFYSDII